VRRADVTLHVGAGTFLPIEVEDLAQHAMHAEWYEVNAAAAAALQEARAAGGRIVAVGTTAARVLESLAGGVGTGKPSGSAADGRKAWEDGLPMAPGGETRVSSGLGTVQNGWTRIFIYPPYQFRNVDALITNFHLPGSTLLALVMAFASPELIRAAYAAAIEERYRFYSYGDAMLIV
jgi:S-adenosylmethionine:tRNA ribosyltransferase-isomerase